MELSVALARVRSNATELNQLSDALNESVREIESSLNKLNLGIHVWVNVTKPEAPEDPTTYLEYRRYGSRYRVVVVTSPQSDPEDEDVRPWGDCSRAVKLETIQKLPELIVKMGEEIESRRSSVEESLKLTTSVLAELNGEGE